MAETERTFEPDPGQQLVLDHADGRLLAVGAAGTGKTAVLRERFARLIEAGADPDRVALVVRSKRARLEARAALPERLRHSLPDLHVLTVHALAFRVLGGRHSTLGYDEPPRVLSAADQRAKVRELLLGEDPARWPAYGRLLGLHGFADQVRQFVLRAQEALLSPDDILAKAEAAGLSGWRELAEFHRSYLQVLDAENAVDFAGLVEQAARAAERSKPLFDHLLVDDYQDTTYGAETLLAALAVPDLVVAGDPRSHIFSFQGATDVPLARFARQFAGAERVELSTSHRASGVTMQAWRATHTSEEHAAVARELRRIHAEENVPWGRLAVVVRRQGTNLGGLLRALDDARVPRTAPETGLQLASEAATHPYVLALRWLARPHERDALVESLLTSELVGLSPASARGRVRAAQAAGGSPADALAAAADATTSGEGDVGAGDEGEEREAVEALHRALDEAAAVADRSVLDAFSILWRSLPWSRSLVRAGEDPLASRRALDAVSVFARAVESAGRSADPSVHAFVASLDPGAEGADEAEGAAGATLAAGGSEELLDAVHVLTAHATAGREFDIVVVVGTVEGDFPSLTRPEPMFDLATLEGPRTRSERNRLRLEDERRLFGVVASRATRRVLFTASDALGGDGPLTARSRFVEERGIAWTAAPIVPAPDPVSVGEAAAVWRRALADSAARPAERLAALDGLLALGVDPRRWWFQRDWTDGDRPLHEGIRVSASRLERLENCDLQFVLSEELGLGRPAGYHAWVGKLVHKLIEECEAGAIERDLEALVAAAQERWRPHEFPSLAVSNAFRRLVTERMLPNWLAAYENTPALGQEVRFEFELDGAMVVGFIDRIGPILAGGNRITDFKTGNPDRAPKAEESLQLGVYYLAAHEAPELAGFLPVRGVELAYLKGHWKTGELVSRRWQVGEKSEKDEDYQATMRGRMARLIAHLRELNETERYRPNTSADCWSCEFKTLCPLFPEGRELFPVEGSP